MSIALVLAVFSLVATGVGFAVGLIKVGMWITAIRLEITAAERRAKHDAIGAVTDKITTLDERKLSIDVHQAELESLNYKIAAASRRLDALERQTGLDGSSGPHRRE